MLNGMPKQSENLNPYEPSKVPAERESLDPPTVRGTRPLFKFVALLWGGLMLLWGVGRLLHFGGYW